jgi:hypothetical protein
MRRRRSKPKKTETPWLKRFSRWITFDRIVAIVRLAELLIHDFMRKG